MKNKKNQEDVEELEQYDRRLCLRRDEVSTEEKETSECSTEGNVIMQ